MLSTYVIDFTTEISVTLTRTHYQSRLTSFYITCNKTILAIFLLTSCSGNINDKLLGYFLFQSMFLKRYNVSRLNEKQIRLF